MAGDVSAVSTAPVGGQRPFADNLWQLSATPRCASATGDSDGGGLPGSRFADLQPGALRVPLAAASPAPNEPDGHHSAWPRRLVALSICNGQCQQAVAFRLQRDPHE